MAKKKMTMQAINEMIEQGMTKADIARELGVSRQALYNFMSKNRDVKKRGRPPMTEEQKAEAKEKRQEALAKNPDMYKKEYRMDKAESLHGGAMQSLERYCTATDEEISEMMGNVIKWYEIGKLSKPQNDDEVEHRIELYFQYVYKTGEKPSMEKLALSLGVTLRSLQYWRDGQFCSARRQELIRNAITALAAMDAELVNNNKIPQVTYIFRAKNFFEMKDQQEMTINHNTKRVADEEELRKRIMDGVIIDGDYEDVEGD
jgi:transposase-like protein